MIDEEKIFESMLDSMIKSKTLKSRLINNPDFSSEFIRDCSQPLVAELISLMLEILVEGPDDDEDGHIEPDKRDLANLLVHGLDFRLRYGKDDLARCLISGLRLFKESKGASSLS